MKMRNLLAGALLALPAFAHAGDDRGQHRAPDTAQANSDRGDRHGGCDERTRSLVLAGGIQIVVRYCGAAPEVTASVSQQDPSSDGKFYTIFTHTIQRHEEDSPSYVLIYQPSAGWTIPTTSLDSMGAIALKTGSLDNSEHSGWVTQKDTRLEQRGLEWLPARQIVMRNSSAKQWVYYRIIRDTRHNLLYVLYQRDDEGGAGQEDGFFDSFTVDPGSVTVDLTTASGPGAYLPPPYPNQ